MKKLIFGMAIVLLISGKCLADDVYTKIDPNDNTHFKIKYDKEEVKSIDDIENQLEALLAVQAKQNSDFQVRIDKFQKDISEAKKIGVEKAK